MLRQKIENKAKKTKSAYKTYSAINNSPIAFPAGVVAGIGTTLATQRKIRRGMKKLKQKFRRK